MQEGQYEPDYPETVLFAKEEPVDEEAICVQDEEPEEPGFIQNLQQKILKHESEKEDKRMRRRFECTTMYGCQGGGLRAVLDADDVVAPPSTSTLAAQHTPAHVWTRTLANKTDFNMAINSIVDIYKESQNIFMMSHVDAHRLSEHIYMRILVKEGLMSESEYEKWEGMR